MSTVDVQKMPVRKPDSNNPRNLNLAGHVGFDSLPDQLVNKSVASGFCFNILCVVGVCGVLYIGQQFIGQHKNHRKDAMGYHGHHGDRE